MYTKVHSFSFYSLLSLKGITPPAAAPPIDPTYRQPASYLCPSHGDSAEHFHIHNKPSVPDLPKIFIRRMRLTPSIHSLHE